MCNAYTYFFYCGTEGEKKEREREGGWGEKKSLSQGFTASLYLMKHCDDEVVKPDEHVPPTVLVLIHSANSV